MPANHVRTIHLLCGLSAALLLGVQAITGLLLTHQDSLVPLFHPEAHAASESARAPLDALLATVTQREPTARLDRIQFPSRAGAALVARMLTPDDGMHVVMLDPATGRALSSGPILAYPEQAAETLHGSLMLGAAGKWMVRITGVALLLMAISGFILWWPRRGRLRAALTINLRAPPRRLLRDLHLVPGAVTALFLTLSAVTGVLMTAEPLVYALVARIAPVAPDVDFDLPPLAPGAPMLSAEDALQRLRARFPGDRLYKVRAQGERSRMIVAVFYAHGRSNPDALNMAGVDRATGKLTVLHDAARLPAGDAALAWLAPVHAGRIYGPLSKLIATLAGLTLLMMTLTGPALWLTKPRKPPVRRPARAAGPDPHSRR
jgi:uncharacterized iron-regulated membrane protein